jgi:hypothetical protein
MLLLATCLGVLQPVTAFAWLYPEHRDITVLAVQRLEPAPRALLEQLWSEAREYRKILIPPDFVVGGMIAYKQVGWFN